MYSKTRNSKKKKVNAPSNHAPPPPITNQQLLGVCFTIFPSSKRLQCLFSPMQRRPRFRSQGAKNLYSAGKYVYGQEFLLCWRPCCFSRWCIASSVVVCTSLWSVLTTSQQYTAQPPSSTPKTSSPPRVPNSPSSSQHPPTPLPPPRPCPYYCHTQKPSHQDY